MGDVSRALRAVRGVGRWDEVAGGTRRRGEEAAGGTRWHFLTQAGKLHVPCDSYSDAPLWLGRGAQLLGQTLV